MTAVDATGYFVAACSAGANYDLRAIARALTARVTNQSVTVDWSRDAGEEWARVLREGTVIGYVWSHGPLAMGVQDLEEVLIEAGLADMPVVLVSSLESKELCVDPTVLESLLRGFRWPNEVNSNELSASDLWWATV